MSCNGRNPYAKSIVRVYNDAPQAFLADPVTTLALEGTPVADCGCSLRLNAASIQAVKSGLYHFSADVTFTATTAGDAVVQLYKDGVALPCAISTQTVVAGSVYTAHVETDLVINTCCISCPAISLRIGGVEGTVNHVCAGALKLA